MSTSSILGYNFSCHSMKKFLSYVPTVSKLGLKTLIMEVTNATFSQKEGNEIASVRI
jgi:hypothetical protein